MKKLPLSYKILISVSLVFIAGASFGYFYFLRPLRSSVEEKINRVEGMMSDLVSRGWPTEPEKFRSLQEAKQNRVELLQDKWERSRQLSQNTFSEQLETKFGLGETEDLEEIINYVTRLDYQEYYSETLEKWRTRDIVLHPAVLNLHEDSISRHVYRLVLQLWTVDAALELIYESGFRPVLIQLPRTEDEIEEAGTENDSAPETVSHVSVEPLYEYKLDAGSEDAYLLELPVKTKVSGTTGDLERLINRLRAGDSWISITSVEIIKVPTQQLDQPDDKLEMFLELSVFYPLSR